MNPKTLLEVIQVYLTYSNGTEVDSIHSTDEAYQAAVIAKKMFYAVTEKSKDFQGTSKLITLDHLGDLSKPNYLLIPEGVNHLKDALIKYNNSSPTKRVNYVQVKYLDPRDFLDMLSIRTVISDRYEEITNFDNVTYIVDTEKHPQYFTSFDGKHLVFDSFKKSEDTALQASKSQVLCNVSSEFYLEDNFVIPLSSNLTSGYEDVVIQECLLALRQETNATVSRRANAFMTKLQQNHRVVGNKSTGRRKYGRRR